MDLNLLTTYQTTEQMKMMVAKLSAKELQHLSPELSVGQVSLLIYSLGVTPNDTDKLLACMLGLSKREHMEAAGKSLNSSQLAFLLSHHKELEENDTAKLYSLFIGVTLDVFENLLLQMTDEVKTFLQKESIIEPIQHLLNSLASHYLKKIDGWSTYLEEINEHIKYLDLVNTTRIHLLDINKNIDRCKTRLEEALLFLNQPLALVWNTNRIDLIDKFTLIKEKISRLLNWLVGDLSAANLELSFKKLLNERIDKLYTVGEPPTKALNDSDLACEALAKFSIWYAEDYADVGLLMDNCDLRAAHIDKSDPKWIDVQAKLNREAQTQLEKIGLSTVKDLKKEYIFSRKSLKEFVAEFAYYL